MVEKIAQFDRERIPERVVHARGASAKGFFEVRHCCRGVLHNWVPVPGKRQLWLLSLQSSEATSTGARSCLDVAGGTGQKAVRGV